MDVVLLSRLQFALTIGFHFLFPPLTLGLSFIIVILETLYLKKRDEVYRNLSSFLVKILGLIFVIGTATGIVMEFSFGTNWSNYSRIVGDVFGAPLAAEGVFAFFLESMFLGVLVFGRKKVSEKFYWWSAFFVFFGSHLSGLWIIIANSWMQTPAGYIMQDGRAILDNFFAAAVNHSTFVRYSHTILSGWIMGAFFVAGVAAWYLLKNRNLAEAKVAMKLSVIIILIVSVAELFVGHWHSVQVAKTQPAKLAAFEALYDTQEGAPLAVFGIPDAKNQKNHLYIGLPKMLSFLLYFDADAKVLGLNEFPEGDRPPVFLTFMSYHIMIILGTLFILYGLIGVFLLFKDKIWDAKWYLKSLIIGIVLPVFAIQFGWITAEVGRQPWVVYGILRTKDAASVVVPAGQILFSLIMFGLIYLLLFIMFMRYLLKIIRKGPQQVAA
ncbi:cytochrome ubiquinol oxidase subunit I [candidate division KSB1 bacterium 4484_87]|nr:MAG: cytochrome ubiquinol oxidase subunit I [candidate division KSB1 bacterium 4484_87]